MLKNYLPLSRDVRNHWLYKDSQYFHVWCEMLFAARYSDEPKTDTYQNISYTVNRGEFIFGRTAWASRLGIGEQKLRGLIKKLLEADMLQIVEQKARRFTIYKIVNYEKYNQPNNQQETQYSSVLQGNSNQPDNQLTTNRQPTDNQLTTTKEESNKEIKKKKGSTLLSDIENYRARYDNGQAAAIDEYIEILKTTRTSGKISDSVILKLYQEMAKHPAIVVQYACMAVINNPALHSKRENYFFGIMRNTKADEAAEKVGKQSAQAPKSNNAAALVIDDAVEKMKEKIRQFRIAKGLDPEVEAYARGSI